MRRTKKVTLSMPPPDQISPKGSESVVVSVRIPKGLKDDIDDLIDDKTSFNRLVRVLLEEYLRSQK